jgi:hypothetical protein
MHLHVTCLQKMECLTPAFKHAFKSSSFIMQQLNWIELNWTHFQMVDNIKIVFVFSVLFRDASIFQLRKGPSGQGPPVGKGPQWARAPSGRGPPHYRGCTSTLRLITLGRIPLDERSDRRSDLHLTTHNIHKGQTSMSPVGFKPTISAGERPQTHGLDRAATWIGDTSFTVIIWCWRYMLKLTLFGGGGGGGGGKLVDYFHFLLLLVFF